MTTIARFGDALRALTEELAAHPEIELLAPSVVAPPAPRAEVEELEGALEVRFPEDLKELFSTVGEVAIRWSYTGDRIPEEDAAYLGGSIYLLPAITMVQGFSGKGWKRGGWEGKLWFDFTPPEIQAIQRRFMPLDMPESGFMVGYCHDDGVLEPTLSIRNRDDEIEAYPLSLEQYLARLLATTGYMYWQECAVDDGSAEHERFVRTMSALFPETFDAASFR